MRRIMSWRPFFIDRDKLKAIGEVRLEPFEASTTDCKLRIQSFEQTIMVNSIKSRGLDKPRSKRKTQLNSSMVREISLWTTKEGGLAAVKLFVGRLFSLLRLLSSRYWVRRAAATAFSITLETAFRFSHDRGKTSLVNATKRQTSSHLGIEATRFRKDLRDNFRQFLKWGTR